jgi:hypothetical protein
VVAIAACAMVAACATPQKGSHSAEGDYPDASAAYAADVGPHAIKTVFVVVMENHDWSTIVGNPSAPYINGTLLPQAAHAERYTSPRNIHPSEPNYIWLEAGDNLAITDDDDPTVNFRTTRSHLTRQMDDAGISWKAYEEDIDPGLCPVASSGLYAAKHDPFVFFDDVTDARDAHSAHCLAHVRPHAELAGDLASGNVARYTFITPNLCNDMHTSGGCGNGDTVANGDAWLARELPLIQASKAYADGGVILVTWDESEGGDDTPIGLLALSPVAKPGYAGMVPYTHSSLLRTVQNIFSLRPLLRDAANATALDDLFASTP